MNKQRGLANLINRLKSEICSEIPASHCDAFSEFIENFFTIITLEELETYDWEDLSGWIFFLWKKIMGFDISSFDKQHAEICVYNPERKQLGWSSRHTIIHVIQYDTPFMVDSVRMKFNEQGIRVYQLLNSAVSCVWADSTPPVLGVLHIEIERQEGKEAMEKVRDMVDAVLHDVRQCVYDYPEMKKRVADIAGELTTKLATNALLSESEAYIRWILDDNFTFLGYEKVNVHQKGSKIILDRPVEDRLGLLKEREKGAITREELEPEMDADFFSEKSVLSFAKASARSTVHRPAYPDFIVIKQLDSKGNVVGEHRVLGLYTSTVFNQSVSQIPLLREKFHEVIRRSGFPDDGHVGKELAQIMQIFPREELFQINGDELFDTVISILQIQERNQTKVFMRQDRNGLFCSVLVYVPKEGFSSDLRLKIQNILCRRLNATDAEFFTFFSESVLARIHFIFRLSQPVHISSNIDAITQEIVEATSSWDNNFQEALVNTCGESEGLKIFNKFRGGIPISYKEKFSAKSAVYDVKTCNDFRSSRKLRVNFYQQSSDKNGLRAKVFSLNEPLPLADQIPVMENLGLRVISEHPYVLKDNDGDQYWIHDFYVQFAIETQLALEDIAKNLQEAFGFAWYGLIENDSFNRLVLTSAMNSHQISMFRAYALYMKQLNIGFSHDFIAASLYKNADISVLVWELFQTRFDVSHKLREEQRLARQQQLQQEIADRLEQVSSLSEDRVIRRYVELVTTTLRTNFYQGTQQREKFERLVFKIASGKISDMPKPVPEFEIFIYSPRFEGVHLRGGKVARGGLRWSDRKEDFRTEILGLVKAQQVKNSVIVPVGAKGGFVCKQLPTTGGRETLMEEGIACYRQFIRGLLDVTDNLENGKVIKPENTICYDDDDFYLVVAADKGTATFSDIANEIANEYNFWLGDAFASGGSVGYDHKKMGITAKGAWVSVQRHFMEIGVDVQRDSITAIGIGDMSGDVFGNGMLLSKKIALVGAFNHLHIFVDPDPDVVASFEERARLFKLPRSSWSDYKDNLISEGGGVFSRSAKSVEITPQMKKRFSIRENFLTPAELISAMLKAPVDLLWNGGIGTYVKSSLESHENAGDHANDALRVNGNDLKCHVVGEGGNLGFTQLGRIEFSLNGGVVNTDFIDNAGGVDCSDHEVNIKILLNHLVSRNKITRDERDKILEKMSFEVEKLVLQNNYRQALALSLAEKNVKRKFEEYRQLTHELELRGNLDRTIEFLPDDEQMNERIAAGKTLTRPELSILMSYTKSYLKSQLLASGVCNDEYLEQEMLSAFPVLLRKKYFSAFGEHRLKSEITATQLANYVCNMMGIAFVNRLQQFVGATPSEVIKAFVIIRDIYDFDSLWHEIEALDFNVDSNLQYELIIELRTAMRRFTRWLLQMNLMKSTTRKTVEYFSEGVRHMMNNIREVVPTQLNKNLNQQTRKLVNQGVPEQLAVKISAFTLVPGLLFIVQTTHEKAQPIDDVATVYFVINEAFSIDWIFSRLNVIDVSGQWDARARESIRDELFTSIRLFVNALLDCRKPGQPLQQCITSWKKKHQESLDKWAVFVKELHLESHMDLAMFTVIARNLADLYKQTVPFCEIGQSVVNG